MDRLVAWITRHWLALFNTIVAIFIGLPFLAPVLLQAATVGNCAACGSIGRAIYLVYRPTCHQLPERSFFLFGPQIAYSLADLEEAQVLPPGLSLWQREGLRFPGNTEIGFKVAFCERDVAIYGAILASGLLFGLLCGHAARRGRALPKLPVWLYGLLLVPLALDGGTQLFSLRESDWLLRLITGGLFGSATVWLAYPYVHDAMADVGRSLRDHPQTGQKAAHRV